MERCRQARDPGRARRPLLRRRPRAAHAWWARGVLPPGQGHRRRVGRRTGSRRTCSRGCEPRGSYAAGGCWSSGSCTGRRGHARPPALVGPRPGPGRRARHPRLAAAGLAVPAGVRGRLVRAGRLRGALDAPGGRLPGQRRTRPGGRSWPARAVRPGGCRGVAGRGTSYARRDAAGARRRSGSSRSALLDSPRAEDPDQPAAPREGGRQVVLLAAARARGARSGGAYVAAHYVPATRCPRGTTVAGVGIGGQPQDEAAERLERRARRPGRRAPIATRSTARHVAVDPAEAGLARRLRGLGRRGRGRGELDPARLWNYFTGGDDFDAEVDGRRARLRGGPRPAADERTAATARDGAVAFDGGAGQDHRGPRRRGARPERHPDRAAGRRTSTRTPTSPSSRWPTCSPTSTRPTSRRRSTTFANPAVVRAR